MKPQPVERLGAGRFADLFANIPGYSLAERLVDIFEKRQRIRLIVTSDNHCELRICWGLVEFTKGSKREFLIEGGPGLCDAALRSLEGSKRSVQIVSRAIGNGNSSAISRLKGKKL
jgi:hypothetical protein